MRVVNSLPQRQPTMFQALNILVTGVTRRIAPVSAGLSKISSVEMNGSKDTRKASLTRGGLPPGLGLSEGLTSSV